MRLLILTLLLATTGALFAQKTKPSFIKNRPEPARVVNDYCYLLSKSETTYLEQELVSYQQRTGNAIVIITLPSLTDQRSGVEYSVEELALLYFNKWGIGDKIKNNGVLLLVSQHPRRVRITTGRGIQDILTDASCQQIINDQLVPRFKSGLFFLGIKEAVEAMETTLDMPHTTPEQVAATTPVTQELTPIKRETKPGFFFMLFSFAFVFGIFALLFLLVRKLFRMIKNGGMTGGGGSYYSGRGYRRPHYHNTTNNFFSSGGSGWGSSGRSSGSSSGGSSSSSSSSSGGSYGGGSSSGGGASGSW
jgi:uncharacterized protein